MRLRLLWSLAMLVSLGACSSDRGAPGGDETPSVAAASGAERALTEATAGSCPLQVKDTTATVEDVDRGVAIRFTTGGDVADVRRRITAWAAMHAGNHGRGAMGQGMRGMGGMARGAGGPGMAHPEMRAADVRTEDIEGGARAVFTPKDPSKLDALRAEVREHAARMSATGGCPMLVRGGPR